MDKYLIFFLILATCLFVRIRKGQAEQSQEPPQEQRIVDALVRIRTALVNIADRKDEVHVPPGMLKNVDYMTQEFQKPGLAPERYASVFEESSKLLARVENRGVLGTDESQAILKDISENFEVIVHSSQAKGIGIRPIPLTVKITREGQELSGWEIFYMEYFLKHVRKDVGPDSYPKPSTATYPLPPGRYLFQARHLNGNTTEQTEQKACTVGLDRETTPSKDSVCVLLVN